MATKNIPLVELLDDRRASTSDIRICQLALLYGVTQYSGGAVEGRLKTNEKIIENIDAELGRRNVLIDTAEI